ncbi:hypothetical protein SASPL_143523 [Salvia splendens]|uniref:Uncharacterized protein n=1 Tax=Salvia splendens TaxID=180675 RepID=A0A8X8WMD6_SALSN|nr:hypothetical protein SASPL_143523 [Salvia splendens]
MAKIRVENLELPDLVRLREEVLAQKAPLHVSVDDGVLYFKHSIYLSRESAVRNGVLRESHDRQWLVYSGSDPSTPAWEPTLAVRTRVVSKDEGVDRDLNVETPRREPELADEEAPELETTPAKPRGRPMSARNPDKPPRLIKL